MLWVLDAGSGTRMRGYHVPVPRISFIGNKYGDLSQRFQKVASVVTPLSLC